MNILCHEIRSFYMDGLDMDILRQTLLYFHILQMLSYSMRLKALQCSLVNRIPL